jgi:hypothetical protein
MSNQVKYFLIIKKGSNLLEKLKNISPSAETIYLIAKTLSKDYSKMNPNYFSKLCGTTGLYVFFIKDILDHLGFSFEKKYIHRSYKTINLILPIIDTILDRLRRILNKFFNLNI